MRKVSHFLYQIGVEYAVTAFTGRACSHIQKEGIIAGTMHSLFLTPVLDDDGNLERWEEKSPSEVKAVVGEVILVDEASMMPSDMYRRIMSIPDTSVVLVGDDAQLPSIEAPGSEPFDGMNLPDTERFTFTRNWRQEGGSTIATLCEHIRQSPNIPRRNSHDVRVLPKSTVLNYKFHEQHQYDVVLCGKNKTRQKLNDMIRTSRGFSGECPTIGEIVICKRNDIVTNQKINNGELYSVEGAFYGDETSRYMLKCLDRPQRLAVTVLNETWQTEKAPKKHKGRPIQLFTFGYAITVHAAQGSQFENILFLDENVSFFLDQQRWRYTAISRASEMLTIAI
jgi:exodeoxyribonuclease-5